MALCYNYLHTIYEQDDAEEVWTPEIESALIEAMQAYPPCGKKLIKYYDGKKYGRNSLISFYIQKKCGKIRTPKQISSHMQFMLKKKKFEYKILNLPQSNYALVPKIFDENMIEYNSSGEIVYVDTRRFKDIFCNFSDEGALIRNVQNILNYKTVASSKLAVIGFFAHFDDSIELPKNNVFCGITCATEAKLPEVKINGLNKYFGGTLTDLFKKGPTDAFYLIKSWANLDLPIPDHPFGVDYMWNQIFYSPYMMDLRMTLDCHVCGQLIFSYETTDFAVSEVILENTTLYLYHLEFPPNQYGKNFVRNLFNLLKLYGEDKNVNNIVKKLGENYTLLLTIKDRSTDEILLVLPCLYDFKPKFSGYKLYTIVP